MTWRSPKNLHRSPPSFQLNTNLSTYRVKPHKTGEVQIPRNSNYCRETCRQENGLWIDWATELSKARVGSDWGSESRSVVSDSATPWTIRSMEFSRPEYWSSFILCTFVKPRFYIYMCFSLIPSWYDFMILPLYDIESFHTSYNCRH